MPTFGYDVFIEKIESYHRSIDPCGEMSRDAFKSSKLIEYSNNAVVINKGDFIVIAVPTPIDQGNQPDLTSPLNACRTVAKHMKRGASWFSNRRFILV